MAADLHRISWEQIALSPNLIIKDGVGRRRISLRRQRTFRRHSVRFSSGGVDLHGHWDESPGFGSLLTLTLKNTGESSLRLTRLVFPAAGGIANFLLDVKPEDVAFLRSGHQSWSTARSYTLKERPLRPWLSLVSLASSNMANLPSNTPGMLSSDMYSVISNRTTGESFLVGQGPPFDQFFYVRLNWFPRRSNASHFELVYDFGRKLLEPGDSLKLDGIVMALGDTIGLQEQYFDFVGRRMRLRVAEGRPAGWSSWYFYYNKVTPADILSNLEAIRRTELPLEFLQIDDGYQRSVGDWLDLEPAFEGRMAELAGAIRDAGYRPGIWIAPFAAERKSALLTNHPEYVLRNEQGKPIIAGYNVFWRHHIYYGLDISNPRFEEYLRRVVHTITHRWGFTLLKLDFLFAGCLRGGTHHDLSCSRAEMLKRGMRIIREEAGPDAYLVGCGMPLSAGIGQVEAIRVGPDTGPYWTKTSGKFLNTAAMVGVRNSVRNVMVRSPMHRRLWLNDPDCLMIRRSRTKLNAHERMTLVNAIVLSGGPLVISDDIAHLGEGEIEQLRRILPLSEECSHGEAIAIDMMESEVPTCFYNTAGLLGVFNSDGRRADRTVLLGRLPGEVTASSLQDVWSGNLLAWPPDGKLVLEAMPPHSSRLFRLVSD